MALGVHPSAGHHYLVHGEPVALDALAARIRATLGWPVHIGAYLEQVELNLR